VSRKFSVPLGVPFSRRSGDIGAEVDEGTVRLLGAIRQDVASGVHYRECQRCGAHFGIDCDGNSLAWVESLGASVVSPA